VIGIVQQTVPALAAMIGVIALGIGSGSLASVATGQKPDRPAPAAPNSGQATAELAPAAPKAVTVAGRVLDPDGNPLAGAKLTLFGRGGGSVELGDSGAGGQFQAAVPADRLPAYLVARAEGLGAQLVPLTQLDPSGEVELRTVEARLRTVKDHVIRGRVVDTQGKPVAGAEVVVARVGVYANNSLGAFLAAWKTRSFGPAYPGEVKALWRDAGVLPGATTDADGRFTVAGAGAERLVTLRVRRAGVAEAELWVVNRAGLDPKLYDPSSAGQDLVMVYPWGPQAWVPALLYGPDLTAVAEAEKPIRGVVTDAETGKPRPGVTVRLAADHNGLSRPLSATTDALGRYAIRGARKANSYLLDVAGDPAAGHLAAQVRAADTPGYEPVAVDIGVKKGVNSTAR
jgi:hypothetical protein